MFRRNLPAAPITDPQYLTAGGATVDLQTLSAKDSEFAQFDARCNGCGKSEYVCAFTPEGGDAASNLKRVAARAGEWAQGHASTCRAVPKASR